MRSPSSSLQVQTCTVPTMDSRRRTLRALDTSYFPWPRNSVRPLSSSKERSNVRAETSREQSCLPGSKNRATESRGSSSKPNSSSFKRWILRPKEDALRRDCFNLPKTRRANRRRLRSARTRSSFDYRPRSNRRTKVRGNEVLSASKI